MKYLLFVILNLIALTGNAQVITKTSLDDFRLKGHVKTITNKVDSLSGDAWCFPDFVGLDNIEYKFDKTGNLIVEKTYDSEDILIREYDYKYDNLNRLDYIVKGIYKKVFYYDSISRLRLIKNRFTDDTDSLFYNNSGDLVKIVSPYMTDEYTYDKKNKSYQITTNQPGGDEIPIFYTTVDSLGNKMEHIIKMKWRDDYDYHVKYQYNLKNHIVSCSVKTLYNEYIKWHFIYVYDSQGNWIERIDFEEGIKFRTYTRLITYY